MTLHAEIRQDLATAVPSLTDRQIATIEALQRDLDLAHEEADRPEPFWLSATLVLAVGFVIALLVMI